MPKKFVGVRVKLIDKRPVITKIIGVNSNAKMTIAKGAAPGLSRLTIELDINDENIIEPADNTDMSHIDNHILFEMESQTPGTFTLPLSIDIANLNISSDHGEFVLNIKSAPLTKVGGTLGGSKVGGGLGKVGGGLGNKVGPNSSLGDFMGLLH